MKLTALFLLISAGPALAVNCQSVGGHINGEPVFIKRQATLQGSALRLDGVMDGKKMPRRLLDCVPLHAGIMCGRQFGPVNVTVMTKGPQMVEAVTDSRTGKDVGGSAYECDASFKLKK